MPLMLWAVFALYSMVLAYTILHHELWVDEIHSWNIAKGSASLFDLLHNIRYEGHPPVWYMILWPIAQCTHNPAYIQLAQWFIAVSVVFTILFFAPFSFTTRLLLPFGYLFLFEYGTLSRNYAIGVLVALWICILLSGEYKSRLWVYYLLLFILSNTHLLALLLAASLHLYFLLKTIEQKKVWPTVLLQAILGAIVLVPALYMIAPPADSEMNASFFVKYWNSKQLITLIQLPARAFLPVPAWWQYHFWNVTLWEAAQNQYSILKWLIGMLSLGILWLACWLLRQHKKSLSLFVANYVLTCMVGFIFPLNSARYAGFVFIAFIAAYWLHASNTPVTKKRQWYIYCLLTIQVVAGLFTVTRDWKYPFSNAYRVKELLAQVPVSQRMVTDYWALNTLSAYADQPFYCIDLQKSVSFLTWNSDFTVMLNKPDRYSSGLTRLFQQEGIKDAYLLSVSPPASLEQMDARLSQRFHVQLVDKREGAIEKGSNLYLYHITLP